tara:strand:+ start:8058 stop:8999 length:942 start_codon:yes stop_codon:yes gene_type:complete
MITMDRSEIRYSDCSIVIPAYNEEASIGKLLIEILELSLFDEIIVVNDSSTDSTKKIVEEIPNIILINNRVNLGNGASVKKGLMRATKEYVVLMDADGQHPANCIKQLFKHANGNQYDLVVGSRKNNKNVSKIRCIGNCIFKSFSSYLAGEKIEDLTSGFRIFRRSAVMKTIHLFPKRYSYPTTSILAMLALGYTIGYLPISEIKDRRKGKSGINPIKDFFRFIKIMLRIAIVFSPAKVFMPLAVIALISGMLNIGYTIYSQQNIQDLGVILIIMAFLVAVFAVLGEQIARIRIEIGVAVANEMKENGIKKKD